ncbi:uncharacterized protein LOC121860290 [Homarus americanus]|uniref:Putative group 7 allergen and hemolymph juvenile hormone-binding protein-like 1 n=1 Tax=Homarus americanus TaxID=6706 RepID=A0A8J5N5C9_HOMAM|nr:uncharacterized protein LOC121860290 [Homarus americanus]KAG7173632.1 putative group 7 allergen and hemolymph juvenile hormone-binding protein-like 1 [Homarus americanus]
MVYSDLSTMMERRWLWWCVVVVVGMVGGARGALDIEAWKGEEPLTPERIVREVVEYFSQRDPHGIPVLKVPESIELPDRVSASQITLWDLKISGHSGLRLEHVNVNLTSFSGKVKISLPVINLQGQYSWPGWFSTSQGATNVTMVGIEVTVDLYLGVNSDGILNLDDLKITLTYDDLILDFENLSTQHSVLVSTADVFFGTFIQPLIIGSAQEKLMDTVNQRLQKKMKDMPFPNSISPIDYAIAKVRREIRKQNLDPVKLGRKDDTLAWGISLQLKDIELEGLATIHRTHEISAQFIDNAVFITIQLGTQELQGGSDWSMSAALLPAVEGHLNILIESLEVTIDLKQPVNIRSPPTLRKIDIRLGNLAVRSTGEGSMDYLLEAFVNIVPNALRNVIMDNIEPRIQQIIQKRLNGLDLYRMVLDILAERRRQQRNKQRQVQRIP